MFTKTRIKIKTFTFFLLLSSGIAKANTAILSGPWETGTNWSTGVAPLATDAVIVPAGITMTLQSTGDVCASLTIAAGGSVIINSGESLSIGGNFSNAGTFLAQGASTLTFNGAANSVINGGGTYTIAATVVMNMATSTTALDVQDANFISGINLGNNYFFTFIMGTWKMDNAGTLTDCYNSGSANSLTIPYGVVIESDNGRMNLCQNAHTGVAILSGKINVIGGIVTVQAGQAFNSGQDFQYHVNGGTPQLYQSGGTLSIGAGFNANAATDFVDFHMTGGVIYLASNGYSNWITFQLADVVGGKTFMSAGLIILQDACNANIEDLDMGGANVAATLYSVTGGTIQLGYLNTQSGASYFGVNAEPATNYPNINFASGVAKNVSAFKAGNVNMLSLHINSNMTFDASGFSNTTITSTNGTYAFDEEGTYAPGNNTITFAGSVNQIISSSSLANINFYNLTIANTSGNVTLKVQTTVANKLAFTSGLVDASNDPLIITNGATAITGASATSYVITGNGVTTTGDLVIDNIAASANSLLPIGTSNYYLPATINPGANAGNSYAAYVFQGATTNAVENGPAFNAAALASMVNAVWNIERTAGTGTATLTLNWLASGTTLEGSSFQSDGLDIGISQYSGGEWQNATGNGNVATETANSTFSSFSQFTIVADGITLPILLTNFNANLNNNNTVLLSWETSNEGNNISDFELQKSINGTSWNTIATVQGNNNLDAENSYSFTDVTPASGQNYYRLLIQSPDGSSTYSPIRMVSLSTASGISVYPNPANNNVNVSLGSAGNQELAIRFINQQGQVLQSSLPGIGNSSIVSLNTGSYANGVYFLQVISSNKVIQTNTVLIAH